MNRSFSAKARALLQRRGLKSRLASTAKIVSCVAVFLISYVLIAPVLTQEWEPVCGLEEHTHTDECYDEVWVEDAEITNDAAETTDDTTDTVTTTERVLTCTEAEGHTHDSGCYETVRGELTCTEEGTEEEPHEHDDGCYDWTEELVCDMAEGHVHDDGCYEEVTVESQPEETETETEVEHGGNGHWERVLVCELPEHTHEDSCYNFHEEDGNNYICGLEAHTHGADCYFEDGSLKCTLPEHTHNGECIAEGGESKAPTTITAEDGTVKTAVEINETFGYENEYVTADVTVKGKVFIPVTETAEDTDEEVEAVETEASDSESQPETSGFELVITESDSDEKYGEYAALAEEDGEVMMLQVLDYSLTLNGEEISLDGCTVDVQVEAKAELQQMMDAPASSAMYALEGETEENAENVEADMTMELAAYSDDNGSMAYAVIMDANPDPRFTVQYYAWLERAVMEEYKNTITDALEEMNLSNQRKMPIINTDGGSTAENSNLGGRVPVNGTGRYNTPNGKSLYTLKLRESDGSVKTNPTLTEIYKSEQLTYKKAPGLMYFNIVNNNAKSQYTLKEIWVLEDETKARGTTEDGWKVVPYTSAIRFTNRKQTADANPDYILIDENAIIRLVYDTKSTEENMPVNFYDYDITDGYIYTSNALDGQTATSQQTYDKTWYANTQSFGINSSEVGSGTRLAFGNSNAGTAYGEVKWGAEQLNKANANSFMIATYGLVQKLDENGHIVYSDGVAAPKLFNEGAATGKTSYDKGEYSLKFDRVGDTYTLKAVNGTQATNLDKFSSIAYTYTWGALNGKTKLIHNNNFWPMDSAPSWGADGHDLKFGGKGNGLEAKRQSLKGNLPESDDGQDHNSYFGMQYAVTFDLSSSYVGPLEYFFFGDDDMWVFLDDKLVCDIGGVHTSVGQYVNLWDYIDRSGLLDENGKPLKTEMLDKDGNVVLATDKEGNYIQKVDENGNPVFEADGVTPVYEAKMTDKVVTYTLTFFYTERGASGSTCWMQFTLPTVVGVDLDSVLDEQLGENTGSVSIQKKVDGIETNEWFEFTISGLNDNYKPLLYNANGELITDEELIKKSGYIIGGNNSLFKIRPEDTLVLRNIPADTALSIVEKGEYDETGSGMDGYQSFVTVDGVEQNTAPEANITIAAGQRVKVVYTNVSSYELPATGGMGTEIFYIVGAALCLTALGLGVMTSRRKESEI